jgi:predicted DsbA family dithiol-disulfide isomerase
MDNSSVCDIYANEGKGAEELQEVVDAVKELAEEEDMELNLTWIRREKNMVADGLSKYAEEGDERYTNGAKMLMQMGKNEEGKKVSTMVKKIMAAESITSN